MNVISERDDAFDEDVFIVRPIRPRKAKLARGAAFVDEREARRVLLNHYFSRSDIERVDRIPQRITNVNFRVRASGRDWVLKHHDLSSAERTRWCHELELKLMAAAYPVAGLQRSKSGETLVEDDGATYSLHAWVSGKQITIDQRESTFAEYPGLVGELARALGRYHHLTASWIPSGDTRRLVAPNRLLEGPRNTATSIRRGRPPQLFKALRLHFRPRKSDFDRWIVASLPNLYRRANYLAATSIDESVDQSDVVMAHNDVHWENLIFSPTFELLALLDFEVPMQLPRAFDVGFVAAVLVGSHSSRLDEFLSVYDETSGQPVDRRVVAIGMHLKLVRSILWSVDAYLSGRVADPVLLATWCRHLYDDLPEFEELPSAVGRRRG